MWSEKILNTKVLAIINIVVLSIGMMFGLLKANLPAVFFAISGICGWIIVMILNEKVEKFLGDGKWLDI